MQKYYIRQVDAIRIKSNSKKLTFLANDSCFGLHGELSVLLRNVKFYFDIKPINKKLSDVILQVILCNIKHLIYLSSLYSNNSNLPLFLEYEKNTWQYYKDNKTPTKSKQLCLEMALSERLLIENYQKIIKISNGSDRERLKKLIAESKECLNYIIEQMNYL